MRGALRVASEVLRKRENKIKDFRQIQTEFRQKSAITQGRFETLAVRVGSFRCYRTGSMTWMEAGAIR